ncbi:MAG: PspA/IM30 family protein [Lachnospiraceae bacterium]|nr:PspA/IM30 family protein [Lachnospiraceae bacterium]
MGILSRFKDIMSSNINALLDKAEDPEKMIDQCLRNLNSDLGKVKSETAAVMAEEARTKRELDACTAEINKYTEYAKKAVTAGNDEDAKQFLQKKASLAEQQADLQQLYDNAKANSEKMKQMTQKLSKDIQNLEERRSSIKAKVKMAKTQEKINSMTSSTTSAASSMDAFSRMEAKANRMLDEANAKSELNALNQESSLSDLESKYDTAPAASSDIDDELAALKAQMAQEGE